MRNLVRVIPRLDLKGPNVIKGLQFDGHRVLGTAEEFAGIYYEEGADELFYQDTVASLYRRNNLLEIVKKTVENIFIPLTVSGGIRSVEDIRKLLRAGADKVAINTAATEDPKLLTDGAKEFGSQCIVSSIEAYNKGNGKFEVWVDYGREVTRLDALDWVKKVEDCGVGEIYLTSVDRDGMGRGFDLDLIHRVSERISVPLIACGGAGKKQHFSADVIEAGADAVSAGSVFHYHYAVPKKERKTMQFTKLGLRMGESIDSGNIDFLNHGYGGVRAINVEPCSLPDVKKFMNEQEIPVRI